MSRLEHAGRGLLGCLSVVLTFLILEAGLRAYHGELLDFSSELPEVPDRIVHPRAQYDSLLGWVPAPGTFAPGESVTADHLRSNGPRAPRFGTPILVTGDSFTFGDEVADSETWPAQLGREMEARVFNAGVFAYGFDQAVLRAERLLETYGPRWVVVAFIRHDVHRVEYAYYSAWKPYFVIERGTPTLRNVPVPRSRAPNPRLNVVREFLGYSLLASAIIRRLLPEWWYYGQIVRVHSDGVPIAVRLAARLNRRVQTHGARLLVVGLSTGGRIGSNEGMGEILGQMAREGIQTLNLVARTEAMIAEGRADLFMPRGHYSPKLNLWVARQVEDYLVATPIAGDRDRSDDTDVGESRPAHGPDGPRQVPESHKEAIGIR